METIIVVGDNYKTLISKGLSYGLKTFMFDGKDFRPKGNFYFNRLSDDTRCIIIDDMKIKNLDPHWISMTDRLGISVDKRDEDPKDINIDRLIINMSKDDFYESMKNDIIKKMYDKGTIKLLLI